MELRIRTYQEQDEESVIALWTAALPSNAPHNEPATTIRLKLETDRDLFFIATVEGADAGTVMGGYDGHRGWIYTMAVAPEHRHRGIGTALMRHIESALADRGCLKINLQVRASNTGVIEFYRKLGYDLDEVLSMGKRLY